MSLLLKPNDVELAGQSLKMLFDTGTNIKVLDQLWFSNLEANQSVNQNSLLFDVYIIDRTSLSHESIEDHSFKCRDLSSFQESHSFDEILSLSSINAKKIIVNFQNNQVIFFWSADSVASLD